MSRVLVIAEAGVNHNGSVDAALRLIDVAADAGADIVKFQTFRAEELVTEDTPMADYQAANTGAKSAQFGMLKGLELSYSDFHRLQDHCAKRGIGFLSTPFDSRSMSFLVEELGITSVKISSGDLTNAPLLLQAARSGLPMIISTGMGTLSEIEVALSVVAFGYSAGQDSYPSIPKFRDAYFSERGRSLIRERVTLLHCTTEYPAPIVEANLRAMDTLSAAFGLPVGFSDHTEGVTVAVAAVARGATVIEKHFTLDRSLPGPDHSASLDPDGLRLLVSSVRAAESCLGDGAKVPAPSERPNIAVARRGLVARIPIARGDALTLENVAVKRVDSGIEPIRLWEILGRVAGRDFRKDERIEL